ncbi:MAG: MarR family winged helix-turn-helix transcriptional regulator [Candidatus Nanopelagicaceae bacterium]
MAIKPRWLTPAEESAWRKYIVASRRLLEALDDDLATNGLSLSDYEILVHLSDAPERRLRMSDLAEKTILSRSRLSHRIKYMEGKGWVERQKCASDKRGTWAVMTNKGWSSIVKAAPDHVESIRKRFIDQISKADQANIVIAFEKVEQSLRNNLEVISK